MTVKLASVACVLLTGFIVPLPVSSRTLPPTRAGSWTVAANVDDGSGAFTNCAGAAEMSQGVGLVLSVDRAARWTMGFAGRLGGQPGETHTVRYRVDRGPTRTARATVVNDSLVQLPLEQPAEFLEELRRGRVLTADGGNERLSFVLRDMQAGLTELQACVQRGSGPAPGRMAEGGPAATGSAVPSEAERRLEAITVAVNILSRAQMSGFELQPPDVPPRLARHDVTWRVQNVTGSLRLVGLNGGPILDKIRPDLISSDLASCPGRFTAEALPGADGKSSSLFTLCTGDNGWAADYLALPRGQGGAYVLSLVAPPDKADALKTMAEALRGTAVQVAYRAP
jgi:hypothetical protein